MLNFLHHDLLELAGTVTLYQIISVLKEDQFGALYVIEVDVAAIDFVN